MKTNSKKSTAPNLPKLDTSKLPVTDPRRKLTKTERKAMSKEDKKTRRAAVAASRPPAKARAVRLVSKFVERLDRMAKRFYPAEGETVDMREALDSISVSLKKIASDTEGLADNWSPKGARSSKASSLVPGTIVCVSEKHVADLKDLFNNTKEMGKLKVLQVIGSRRVAVQTEGGTRTILKINEVSPVATTSGSSAAAE